MSGRIRVSEKAERTLGMIVFASRAEKNRYLELKLLEKAGEIKEIELQPIYILLDAYNYRGEKVRAITYRADFRYFEIKTNRRIVEDCKGYKTEVYKLKKKLLLAKYDIDFRETKA
jgi:hypothetical protein